MLLQIFNEIVVSKKEKKKGDNFHKAMHCSNYYHCFTIIYNLAKILMTCLDRREKEMEWRRVEQG